MFLGEYQNSIDAKGRAIIPAKFREELGESFVITKGLETCLFIYPMSQWEKFEDNLEEQGQGSPEEAHSSAPAVEFLQCVAEGMEGRHDVAREHIRGDPGD